MNVGTLNSRMPRLESPAARSRTNEPAIIFDNTERRMEHSSFQVPNMLQDFWNLTQRMPRQDQMSFAATVLASQAGQNGISSEARPFLANLKERFSGSELDAIQKMVRNHPSLQNKPTGQIDAFWEQVEQVWSELDSQKADDGLPTREAGPAPRTPEEIYFQTTLNTIKRVDKALTL
ncbi:MAG TPA: hypothetical protein PLP29_04775 [Candidatus Ozemobacteraceae bacterium]|nr:hypothetical protein [Candidatus Ozemobacteraceae bacterium]